jgi:hypothetical protein
MFDFGFPFTTENVIDGLVGKEMVIADNVVPGSWVHPQGRMVLTSELPERLIGIGYAVESETGVSSWRVDSGVLHLMDERGSDLYRLDGVEVRSGSVYATGENLRSASTGGLLRCVVYPFRSILDVRLKVAISSHVDYCEETVPRLIRSLLRYGIERDQIMVAVAGDKKERSEMVMGVQHHYVEKGKMGWTAWQFVDGAADYWLFLQDTCEATVDFGDRLAEVDIGIAYDMVRLANDKRHDLGFFSATFVSDEISGGNERPDAIGPRLISRARLISMVGGASNGGTSQLKDKDVYGRGTKRKVLLYGDMGLKKYAGSVTTGGTP